MCEDCRRRAVTNPLRVLDCKVPADQPIIDALPSILDYLSDEDREHFRRVREFLDDRHIAYTVKGLDWCADLITTPARL
jgi:histidyl-tRNA synthetase